MLIASCCFTGFCALVPVFFIPPHDSTLLFYALNAYLDCSMFTNFCSLFLASYSFLLSNFNFLLPEVHLSVVILVVYYCWTFLGLFFLKTSLFHSQKKKKKSRSPSHQYFFGVLILLLVATGDSPSWHVISLQVQSFYCLFLGTSWADIVFFCGILCAQYCKNVFAFAEVLEVWIVLLQFLF